MKCIKMPKYIIGCAMSVNDMLVLRYILDGASYGNTISKGTVKRLRSQIDLAHARYDKWRSDNLKCAGATSRP